MKINIKIPHVLNMLRSIIKLCDSVLLKLRIPLEFNFTCFITLTTYIWFKCTKWSRLPIRVLYDPTWKKKFGANSVMTARSILAVAQEQFRNAYLTVFIDLKVVSIESTTMVIPSNSAGLYVTLLILLLKIFYWVGLQYTNLCLSLPDKFYKLFIKKLRLFYD